MSDIPVRSDPEIAAATFADHLDRALASPAGARWGWKLAAATPLEAVVGLTGVRADGRSDQYYLRLRADWYDQWPPHAVFVRPDRDGSSGWLLPGEQSRWMPRITNFADSSFAFHVSYPFGEEAKRDFPEETRGQLICCSMSFGYYISGHGPAEGQRWKQGQHTASALLARVQLALLPPHYEGTAGDLDT